MGYLHEMDTMFPGLHIDGGKPVGNGEIANVLRSMRWDNQEYAVFWISVNLNEEYAKSPADRNHHPSADPMF